MRALRTTLAMDAYRRGDQFLVEIDLPGVDPEDVDVTVERNVVNIRARRASEHDEGANCRPRWRTASSVSSSRSRRRASRDEWRSQAGSIVG